MGDVENQNKYWDDFWTNQLISSQYKYSWPEVTRYYGYKRIIDFFSGKLEGLEVLECGSGSAQVTRRLLRYGAKCNLIDISKKSLENAYKEITKEGFDVGIFHGDANSIITVTNNKKYDLIYSGGLLQHLEDLNLIASSMASSLREGGVIIADYIPNKPSLQKFADIEKSVVYFLKNFIKGNFKDIFNLHSHIPSNIFVNDYSTNEYRKAFEDCGLNTTIYTATIYPSLALPKFLERYYSKFLLSKYSKWESLYSNKSKLLKSLCLSFTIYATKEKKS